MHVRAWMHVYDPHSWRTEMGPVTYTNTAVAHKIGTRFRKYSQTLSIRAQTYIDLRAAGAQFGIRSVCIPKQIKTSLLLC